MEEKDLSLKDWTGPGADEYMDLPPDADLLAEWAEHDAERCNGSN